MLYTESHKQLCNKKTFFFLKKGNKCQTVQLFLRSLIFFCQFLFHQTSTFTYNYHNHQQIVQHAPFCPQLFLSTCPIITDFTYLVLKVLAVGSSSQYTFGCGQAIVTNFVTMSGYWCMKYHPNMAPKSWPIIVQLETPSAQTNSFSSPSNVSTR